MFGQMVDMGQPITLNYRNVRLGDAIQDISTRYNINFSYSRHYIPMTKRIDLRVESQPLFSTLDRLFEGTNVIYANIGDQVVLKKGKTPEVIPEVYGSIEPPMRAIDRKEEPEEVFTASNLPYKDVESTPVLVKYNYGIPKVISDMNEPEDIDPNKYYVEAPEHEPDFSDVTAQVSLVPRLGTNMNDDPDEITNNLSLNVLGGENGGVEGVEVGGLFNKVKNDMNGVQVAGLFNTVGGDVGPSVLIDGDGEKSLGVQVAGLVNSADNVEAIQCAGLVNKNKGDFRGVQFGGLTNIVGGDAEGVQFSFLSNFNGGDAEVQVAGITNIADDVKGTQVSAIFNRAEKVDGVQFGLINVCDTVTGASIGLLNFVKKGYNQFEVGGSETMYGEAAVRFGSRRFYNIIQFGTQFENGTNSLGYGIGTVLDFEPENKWQSNAEVVLSFVIEDRLNMLFQLRYTWEYKMAKRSSIYFGPTLDLQLARFTTLDTQDPLPDSDIAPYYLFHNNNNQTINREYYMKGWIGFRAGIRFGRN